MTNHNETRARRAPQDEANEEEYYKCALPELINAAAATIEASAAAVSAWAALKKRIPEPPPDPDAPTLILPPEIEAA